MVRAQSSRRHARIILIVIISIFLTTCQPIVNAEVTDEEATLAITEDLDEVTWKLVQGTGEMTFNFHLEETGGKKPAYLRIYPIDLLDKDTGKIIQADQIQIYLPDGEPATEKFWLDPKTFMKIRVVIDTKDVKASTYIGKIRLFGYNNTRDLDLPLKIQVRQSLWYPGVCVFVGVVFSLVINALGLSRPNARENNVGLFQATISTIKKQFQNWEKWVIILVSLFLSFVFTFTQYYPRIGDFGASILDYFAAFIFGLGTQSVFNAFGDKGDA